MNSSSPSLSKSLINKIYYFGFRYWCPFCDSHLRTFFPTGRRVPVIEEKKIVGLGRRENGRCPVCSCLDRERLVYLFLLKETDVFSRAVSLMHVAPSLRFESLFASKKNIDYLTIGLDEKRVSVKMDITSIQYPDNSFDVILCNHVLEHVVNDRKAMFELHRSLKPNGFAVLQVPYSMTIDHTIEDVSMTDPSERLRAYGSPVHVRLYSKKDYIKRLEQTGFTVTDFRWQEKKENFGFLNNKFGLNENESLFYAKK